MSTSHIYSQNVWYQGSLQALCLEIDNEKILAISKVKHEHAVDYGSLIIMPGVIDAHVHINEPGRTEWEGFETATKAAAKGGTTTVVDMPLNSSPVVTHLDAFTQKQNAAQGKLYVNCGFYAGAIDHNFEEVQSLINAGCLGVKVFLSHSGLDEFPNISQSDLEAIMSKMASQDVPILAHCEFDTLAAPNIPLGKEQSYMSYLSTRPKSWENEAVQFFGSLAERYNCKAHVVHLASEEVLEWLKNKKRSGAPITVETCPHYLFFEAEQIDDGNTLLKCAPPIRTKETQTALIDAIKTGVIDFIATDHSPAPPDLKALDTGDFGKAWGGIAGLQFLLSSSWTSLKEFLSLEEFIPLLTSKPAQFLGVDSRIGEIKEGMRADLCIWNPNKSFMVSENMIEHKHKVSPYVGFELYGEVFATYVNGSLVYQEGRFKNVQKGEMILRGQTN